MEKFTPRVGQPAQHNGREGTVQTIVGVTAQMRWSDGSTGYVRLEALTAPAPIACSVAQALDFVDRVSERCANEGGRSVAVPLRVLRALAEGVRRAG